MKFIPIHIIKIFTLATLIFDITPPHVQGQIDASKSLIDYYEVPFSCSVKPGLGCGSAAKPVIIKLLDDFNIEKTRLNHQGNILEVTWNVNVKNRVKNKVLRKAFASWEFSPIKLKPDSLQDEIGNMVWHLDLAVDTLSMEEANENALILIKLIEKTRPLNGTLKKSLFEDIENYYRKELVIVRDHAPLDRWEMELNKIILTYFKEGEFDELDFYH